MTLVELYSKLPVEKHPNIRVIGNQVIYDAGTAIHVALLLPDGTLVPTTAATRNALAAL